jgi:hypothetical protein
MVLQLAECSGPAFLMAAATFLVAEARMCEREFGPLDNGAKPDSAFEKRLAPLRLVGPGAIAAAGAPIDEILAAP